MIPKVWKASIGLILVFILLSFGFLFVDSLPGWVSLDFVYVSIIILILLLFLWILS